MRALQTNVVIISHYEHISSVYNRMWVHDDTVNMI